MVTIEQIQNAQNLQELANIYNAIDDLLEEGKIDINQYYELVKQVMNTYRVLELCQFDGDCQQEGY